MTAARDRYDTAKFTDHEIADELGNVPPRHRSKKYLDALRAERDRRSAAKSPCPNCGATDWTMRLGLGIPRRDGKPPVDVCNVCSPAKPRNHRRWWHHGR